MAHDTWQQQNYKSCKSKNNKNKTQILTDIQLQALHGSLKHQECTNVFFFL